MKKITFISLVAIAVMGWMPARAGTWDVTVYFYNSTELPVNVALDCDWNTCNVIFPGDCTSAELQPGQSTYCTASTKHDSIQWTNVYCFMDGTPLLYQPVNCLGNADATEICADPSTSGVFAVSEGTFVDATFSVSLTGGKLAAWLGLKGVAKIVVGGLIDAGMIATDRRPKVSVSESYSYSITIGQSDYNINKLAVAAWGSSDGSTPPILTFVQGQQVNQYRGSNTWSSSEYLSNNAMIAATFPLYGYAWIGTVAGQIAYYSYPTLPMEYTTFFNTNAIVQVCANYTSTMMQYVAAFSDSSVEYYDGTTAHVLQSAGWNSAILQMCVNWPATGNPQVLVGLADGAVIYFDGSKWTNIQPLGWGTSVMQLKADWDDNNNLAQVVAGLGNGAVMWWKENTWTTLRHTVIGTRPVYQLDVSFHAPTESPEILLGLSNGEIYYFPLGNTNYSVIKHDDYNFGLLDVWGYTNSSPIFLAGFKDGTVSFYNGTRWEHMQAVANSNRIQYISAKWDYTTPPDKAPPYVYCCNYQFTYVNGHVISNYPAIPSADSLCGDIDGDGKDDLISVQDSKWYAWFSSSQYQVRGGPYDTGVYGTPLTMNIDGDIPDDLISIVGKNWYVWPSSSGYTQRIGPYGDLGVYGKPLTGDIDGDGQKDLIMVRGALWYYWSSSSGYTQRIGPFDTGHRGLPAAGDLNGDGLADLVSVVGSDWYVCYSIAPGEYGPWCGPYNTGISGAPVIGDLNGDGLHDLVIVVGSNWYVCYAVSPGQYGPWSGPFALSVL